MEMANKMSHYHKYFNFLVLLGREPDSFNDIRFPWFDCEMAKKEGLVTIDRTQTPGNLRTSVYYGKVTITIKGHWIIFRDSHPFLIPQISFIERIWNWITRKHNESLL